MPSNIATTAPPNRCPETTDATGKFTICATSTNAATNPTSGSATSRRGTSLAAIPIPHHRHHRRTGRHLRLEVSVR